MDFAQRRVIQVQAFLMMITLLKYFVPYSDLTRFDSYLISFPITITFMLVTFFGLLLGLVLNSRNQASFKSAYFIGSLFFPLMWAVLNIGFFVYDFFSFSIVASYSLIVGIVSLIIVGLYVFYALFYNDPLDWTSHKVDKHSIQFKSRVYIVITVIALILLVVNLNLSPIAFNLNSYQFINTLGFFTTLPILSFLVIWVLLLGLINSNLLVVFRDRLYFFVALTIAMISSIWASIDWDIFLIFFSVITTGFNGSSIDILNFGYAIMLYGVIPISLFVMSYLLHEKYKLNLTPFTKRSFGFLRREQQQPINALSKDQHSTMDNEFNVDALNNSYNSSALKDKSGDYMGSIPNLKEFKVNKQRLIIALPHLTVFILFLVGFFFSSQGLRFISFSLFIGFYVTIIIVAQLGLLVFQSGLSPASRPSFNNLGLRSLIIIQVIYFPITILSFLTGWSPFASLLGILIQGINIALSLYTYKNGDNYIPELFTSIEKIEMNLASSGSISGRLRDTFKPSSKPTLESRPAPRPKPPAGSRPAPRLEPVPGSRPGRHNPRPAPRPAPITESIPQVQSSIKLEQEKTTINDLETTLNALKRLFDEGLITEQEYIEKKQQQLDKL
jgi:hypothetical protein